jgi:hypothetical protein
MSSGKQIVLAKSKTNDGKEAFVVPDLTISFPDWPSGNLDYSVTVSASSDVSDGPGMVSIVPSAQKAAITLPKGGEQLAVGQTYRITWTSSQTDKVYLYLDNNSGRTGSASTYITPGGAVAIPATQGYYDWTITSQQLQGMANLDQSKYKIRIATSDYKVKIVPNDFTLFGTPVTTYTGYFTPPADKESSGFFSISR